MIFYWTIAYSGTLAEDTWQNLNPISLQAVMKRMHLLVDKLISTKYECHSRIPLVAACSLKEIGWSWPASLPL